MFLVFLFTICFNDLSMSSNELCWFFNGFYKFCKGLSFFSLFCLSFLFVFDWFVHVFISCVKLFLMVFIRFDCFLKVSKGCLIVR